MQLLNERQIGAIGAAIMMIVGVIGLVGQTLRPGITAPGLAQ